MLICYTLNVLDNCLILVGCYASLWKLRGVTGEAILNFDLSFYLVQLFRKGYVSLLSPSVKMESFVVRFGRELGENDGCLYFRSGHDKIREIKRASRSDDGRSSLYSLKGSPIGAG